MQEVNYSGLLSELSEPIMRSFDGVIYAKQHNSGEFIFIRYDELVDNTQNTLNAIYDFCEIDRFQHALNDIDNEFQEDDSVYGMLGQHHVRPTISKRTVSVNLPEHVIKKCHEMNRALFD